MGKHFGDLAYIRGIVYYALSAHEMGAWAMVLPRGLPNVATRTAGTVLTWLPTFLIGAFVYKYVEHQNWLSHRKNPEDYLYEVDPDPPKVCKRVMELRPPCKKPSLDDIVCPPPEKDPCEPPPNVVKEEPDPCYAKDTKKDKKDKKERR